MTRMHRIALRIYLPTLACLLLAFAFTWVLSGATQDTQGGELFNALRWLPHALTGVALVLGAVASLRLRRWEAGDALICACGGLLGSERDGRFGRYRTCIACGRHHVVDR